LGGSLRARARSLEKHGKLMEAHNRLAGVIARCERKIGQELRVVPLRTGGDAMKARSGKTSEVPPTLAEMGITYDQSAAYQDMASVEENVILDAIDRAGQEGREGRLPGRAGASFAEFPPSWASPAAPWARGRERRVPA
jgi:hypothetical protein